MSWFGPYQLERKFPRFAVLGMEYRQQLHRVIIEYASSVERVGRTSNYLMVFISFVQPAGHPAANFSRYIHTYI